MDEWDDFEHSSSWEDVFVLFRGDQNERVERKVRKSQITIERLSMMFHVSNSRISIFILYSLNFTSVQAGRIFTFVRLLRLIFYLFALKLLSTQL
jgi:hypothetical protein